MLSKIISYLTGKTKAKVVVPRKKHCISRSNISPSAIKVLYRLKDFGFDAYLVGGGVRDLLLGLKPKDFDIVTNALPEDIRKVFSNSRLIGRRFKLVHIYFGNEIIEVATFRANQEKQDDSKQISEQGLIIRDNVFGTLEEDCYRRDFTVNALYYDISDFSVVDHTGGLKDLKKKILRVIGDPRQRYQEDPVRMLRVIRFAAKLDFTVEVNTAKPIKEMSGLLSHVSSSRLYDDSVKILLGGSSLKSFYLLEQYNILDKLFPLTTIAIEKPEAKAFVCKALENTDIRLSENKTAIPAFIYACLLWYPVLDELGCELDEEKVTQEMFDNAANSILSTQRKIVSIPWRTVEVIKDIWHMQLRLQVRKKKKVDSIFNNMRFRAAYDFLLLRASTDVMLSNYAIWWTDYVQANESSRTKMVNKFHNKKFKKQKSRGRNTKRKSKENVDSEKVSGNQDEK